MNRTATITITDNVGSITIADGRITVTSGDLVAEMVSGGSEQVENAVSALLQALRAISGPPPGKRCTAGGAFCANCHACHWLADA